MLLSVSGMWLCLQQEDEEGINPLIKVWNFDKVSFVIFGDN